MRLLLLFAVFFTAVPALAAPCADAEEMEAIRIRALQTELMVAALSCDARSEYNRFISRFKPELKKEADTLKSYFNRVYGASGEKEMNRFITRLANDVSKRSARQGTRIFCSETGEVMDETAGSNALRAIDYEYAGSIRACRGKTPRILTRTAAVQTPAKEKPSGFSWRKLWPF